jgi:hypothetical protein
MKPLNPIKGLIVVILILKSIFSFSQSNCDLEDPYLLTYQFSIPSFIQLFNEGYCVSGDISDTTIYFKFYPENQNGVIYWGYSSPLGYPLEVMSISIYDSNCQLISQGQSVSGLENSLYYVQFDLRTTYIDNFCPYFLPINPLAVNFGTIEAKQIENLIVVDWITLSESNSNYFVIQYSYDLNRWYSTKPIQSSKNSSTNRYYTSSFIPQSPGTIYIRVAEYDYNGDINLSEITYCTYIPKPTTGTPIYDLSGRLIGIRNF